MATTPPYGGQWKDPKTGSFDQAGYKNYIDTINKNYIDRLRTTPNAEGKYRTTAGYSVGGKDIGLGVPLGGAPLTAPQAGTELSKGLGVAGAGGANKVGGGKAPATNVPVAGIPRVNTVRGVNQANLPQGAVLGSPLPTQNPRVVFRPNLRSSNPTPNPLANAEAGARTEGDERARRQRELEEFFRSLGIAGTGLIPQLGVGAAGPAALGFAGAKALGGVRPGVSGIPQAAGIPEEARLGGGLNYSTNLGAQSLGAVMNLLGGGGAAGGGGGGGTGTGSGWMGMPTLPGGPSYPTIPTGGGANMQAPDYSWTETNPPNQWLTGYGASGVPYTDKRGNLVSTGGYEPVTPGFEFPGDPGIAGWRIDPNETEQAPTPAFGGGPALPAPSRGGGGGGGGDGGGYGGWGEYDLESHPEWWKGLSAGNSEDQQFASILNSMIPSMSPEDQRTAASTLARMFPEFESYNSLTNQGMTPPVPGEVTDATTQQYETTQRAQSILEAITRMGAAGGIKTGTSSEVSPAVAWLQQIADLGKDFGISGATEMMTPTQLQALMAALDPLLAEGKGAGSKVAPYAEIARMLTDPFYSAGKVFPRTQGANGQMAFGQPNRTIF